MGIKAFHSPATISASRGSNILMEQLKPIKQSPLCLLLRAANFKPCPLPGLRFLYCRSRAEKSPSSIHGRDHFHNSLEHIVTLPEFPLDLHHHHYLSSSWFLPHTQQFYLHPSTEELLKTPTNLSYLTTALQQHISMAKPH